MRKTLREIVAGLTRHRVDYVLIGGLAAVAWQSPYPTQDIDICPSKDSDNLARLASALTELRARRVTDLDPEGVEVEITKSFLQSANELAFMTPFGPIDLVFVPMGTKGYEDLVREAVKDKLFDRPILVASRSDVVRMKDARGLPKDRLVVDLLRELEERDQGTQEI